MQSGLRHLRHFVRCLCVAIVLIVVAAVLRVVGTPAVPAVVVAVAAAATVRSALSRSGEIRSALWRVVLVASLMVAVSAITWSYTGALTDPGSAPVADRTANWMRDHHLNLFVDTIEQYLYGQGAPGGNVIDPRDLPNAAPLAGPPGAATTPIDRAPPPAGPLIDGTLAGEGHWVPNTRTVEGAPATYTTFVRPDPAHRGVFAAAVLLDPAATRIVYVPGTVQPGGSGWAWGSGIPADQLPDLVAAFNSGWRQKDHPGGVYTEGRMPAALVEGRASLVIYADGHNDVGTWGTDVTMTANVVSVRQNLDLIVDDSQPVGGLATSGSGKWGKDKYQLQFTLRSGLGITGDGALIYVAGAHLTTETLARALSQVGAVRAMELDIHPPHPTFNFFAPAPGRSSGVASEKLLPVMARPSTRYLSADQRDFFAVLTR